MERNIKQKIDTFSHEFKQSIHKWLSEHTIKTRDNVDVTQTFLQYVYDFETLSLKEDDFKKRKRVKNQIPNYERCCALRINNERCTRKKKEGILFCGTHVKGTPYGTIKDSHEPYTTTKVEIWLEEINGVHQYIDVSGNVYSTEDINACVNPPRIISNWKKDINGNYTIK